MFKLWLLVFVFLGSGNRSIYALVNRRVSIRHQQRVGVSSRPLVVARSSVSDDSAKAFDAAVLNRFACKHFRRFKEDKEDTASDDTPSVSDPSVVQQALSCLELAQRAPSSFNTQPYKVILVHSPEQKKKLAKGCMGPNIAKVFDSDCTAVFLADREILRTMPRFQGWTEETRSGKPPLPRKARIKNKFYIALFSSGYSLPRLLAAPISFCVRTVFSFTNLLTKSFYPMPSLASAETWSTKNAMLVAMTYMLACSSRGLATCPMEGVNASLVRRALNVPRRYAVPIIVSTGKVAPGDEPDPASLSKRYPFDEFVYQNEFGQNV